MCGPVLQKGDGDNRKKGRQQAKGGKEQERRTFIELSPWDSKAGVEPTLLDPGPNRASMQIKPRGKCWKILCNSAIEIYFCIR